MGTYFTDVRESLGRRRGVRGGCTCPACEGLECMCRPRFYAGQLLTEEELNQLDRYITAKQRLHNRYLHGWGVVCGLDVRCDPCGEGLTVTPGYALGPCGEDIIVCEPASVDVCALITACRDDARRACAPFTKDCTDEGRDWVVAIRYQETAERGVVPLRSGGCGCGCGGSNGGCGCSGGGTRSGGRSSGGCGCGGHGASSHGGTKANGGCGCGGGGGGSATATRTSAALACEPSVTCEGYRFEVYKVPSGTDERGEGAMTRAFTECLAEFLEYVPGTMPGAQASDDQRRDWVLDARDGLGDYFDANPPYSCLLPHRAARITMPPAGSAGFAAAYADAEQRIIAIYAEIVYACMCRAMMPPCPEPAMDARVPLATVTVIGDDCRIVRVCNWTSLRKYATTFPSLQYWLSVLPYGQQLRQGLEQFCCKLFARSDEAAAAEIAEEERSRYGATGAAGSTPAPGVQPISSSNAAHAASTAGTAGTASTASAAGASTAGAGDVGSAENTPAARRAKAFSRLAFASLLDLDRSMDADTLTRGMLGGVDDAGRPILGDEARANLLPHALLEQLAKPMMRAASPIDPRMLATAAGLFAGGAAPTMATMATMSTHADTATELESLREAVRRQQEQIDDLMRRFT